MVFNGGLISNPRTLCTSINRSFDGENNYLAGLNEGPEKPPRRQSGVDSLLGANPKYKAMREAKAGSGMKHSPTVKSVVRGLALLFFICCFGLQASVVIGKLNINVRITCLCF